MITLSLFSCETDEEKARNLVNLSLAECKKMEGEFITMELNVGKDEVLKSTCDLPISSLEMKEGFNADAKVGPYTWSVGLHEISRVWVLTNISWEALNQAIRMTKDDAKVASREKGLVLWEDVQKEVPSSSWIREQRFDNILKLRKKTRGKTKNPTELGPAKQAYLELVGWSSKNNPDLSAETILKIVNYFSDQGDKLEMALESIGSQDGHFEALITLAKKEKDKKSFDKYSKILEDSRASRDSEIEAVEKKIATLRKHACEESTKIKMGSVKNTDLKKTIQASLSGLNCK